MTNETAVPARKNHALLISAVVLAVIALFQMGLPDRTAIASPFPADVASNGDYTMVNLSQSNEDILLVLDGRNEVLSAYHIRNKNLFEPITGTMDLKALFAMGKRMGAGSK